MTITLTREEAQQVLDAMTRIRWAAGERDKKNRVRDFDDAMDVSLASIETLRARLSAPEPKEKKYTEESCPVCGYYCLGKGGVNCIDKPKLCVINTAPPQREWQGLTDEEIKTTLEQAGMEIWFSYRHAARAIEAKLKEKNT